MEHRKTKGATLVTGATRGIGRAICDRLARGGHDVIGIARRAVDDFPGDLVICDLADSRATADALNEILSAHGVDHLVNNAGISAVQKLQDLDFSTLREMMEVNVRAAAQCAKACVPSMISQRYGRIVNITSRALLGRAGTSSYSASKAALDAMTKCWALELAEYGITVNSVAPGYVETEMMRRNNSPGSDRDKAIAAVTPMGRPAAPDEVAGAVEYFLASHSGFTTGQTLFVCGGWSVSAASS